MIELLARRRINADDGLPYDAVVEYVESNGSQYVDTGYTPVQGDEVYIEFQVLSSFAVGEWAALFSAGTGTYQLICLPGKQSGNSTLNFAVRYFRKSSGIGRMYANGASSSKFNQWGTITVDSTGKWTWDKKTTTGAYAGAIDGNNTSLYLFMHRDGTLGISARIGKITITNGGVTKLDLVAVRKNSAGYMYDTVSNTLKGSGDLSYGNDKTT